MITSQKVSQTFHTQRVTIFNLTQLHKGYKINEMCTSLRSSTNRAAYSADEESYMLRFNLSEREKELVRKRDWNGLINAGGNIYCLMKLGFVVHHGLYHMGAQMRGEDFETFMASRNGKGAR